MLQQGNGCSAGSITVVVVLSSMCLSVRHLVVSISLHLFDIMHFCAAVVMFSWNPCHYLFSLSWPLPPISCARSRSAKRVMGALGTALILAHRLSVYGPNAHSHVDYFGKPRTLGIQARVPFCRCALRLTCTRPVMLLSRLADWMTVLLLLLNFICFCNFFFLFHCYKCLENGT